jgi:uncharacterized protein YjdB
MSRHHRIPGIVVWSLLVMVGCTQESVTAVDIGTVSVSPPEVSTPEGEEVRFAATVRDDQNGPLEGAAVTWSSDDESVVRIDQDGRATALAPGTARVRASFRDASGEAVVTVVSDGGLDDLLPLDLLFGGSQVN